MNAFASALHLALGAGSGAVCTALCCCGMFGRVFLRYIWDPSPLALRSLSQFLLFILQ